MAYCRLNYLKYACLLVHFAIVCIPGIENKAWYVLSTQLEFGELN